MAKAKVCQGALVVPKPESEPEGEMKYVSAFTRLEVNTSPTDEKAVIKSIFNTTPCLVPALRFGETLDVLRRRTLPRAAEEIDLSINPQKRVPQRSPTKIQRKIFWDEEARQSR